MSRRRIDTPIGILSLHSNSDGLLAIQWPDQPDRVDGDEDNSPAATAIADRAATELAGYFSGESVDFTVPLAPRGTPFQQQVWTALRGIAWGRTASYGEVAQALGKPNASRAVGAAAGRNPIPIIIPCHRMLGKNGALTGFAGGVDVKGQLLRLEGVSV